MNEWCYALFYHSHILPSSTYSSISGNNLHNYVKWYYLWRSQQKIGLFVNTPQKVLIYKEAVREQAL